MADSRAIWISLLRGINVSGRNPIKMDTLRKLYEGLGYLNITTYLQSGNVIFEGDAMDCTGIAQRISLQIAKDMGLQVPVIVISPSTLKRIIDENPYQHDPAKDMAHLYVSFLASSPQTLNQDVIESKLQPGEAIRISDHAAYLYCPGGYGRTRVNNNFLETKLGVVATTRNWKTTQELYRIAQRTE
jgi:uncharacterized protein (DUF1697 family)